MNCCPTQLAIFKTCIISTAARMGHADLPAVLAEKEFLIGMGISDSFDL